MKNNIAGFFILMLTIALSLSCSKDDEPSSSYPKDVSITYKITKISGDMTSGDVTYINETGGASHNEDATLPYTKVVERKVNQYDAIGFQVGTNGGGTVKLEILVNEEVVTSQEFTDDADFVIGSLNYQFK